MADKFDVWVKHPLPFFLRKRSLLNILGTCDAREQKVIFIKSKTQSLLNLAFVFVWKVKH